MSQPWELTQHENKLSLCSSLAGNPAIVERERFKLQEKKAQQERIKELL